MEEIIKVIIADPDKEVSKIVTRTKSVTDILDYRKEFLDHDREIRDTQVGETQSDKMVGSKKVKAVRIPINIASKIVSTAIAFEVGQNPTITPSEDNNLAKLTKQIWKVTRQDSLLKKLLVLKKSETQGAIQYYIKDVKTESLINKLLVKIGVGEVKKEIKSKLLDNSKGVMTPYFDSSGDMKLFFWQYETIDENEKEFKAVEIWDEKNLYIFNDKSSKLTLVDTKPHGFDRIPIVYESQEKPEWFIVKELIDRLESVLSKLGGSNDYTAYPLLLLIGKMQSTVEKDDNGKVLEFPMLKDEDGKYTHGDAKFLQQTNAADSIKLEISTIEDYIEYISSTPKATFSNMKGIGALSGTAIELMYLEPMMKAANNEGDNRTTIERMHNIIISGITTTIYTKLASESSGLYFDIEFNSVLPNDIVQAVKVVSEAVASKVMSRKTAVQYLAMTGDNEEELNQIELENTIVPEQ